MSTVKKGIRKGLIKGMPISMLVSLGIHMILLLIAGGFVVFKLVEKPNAQFIPPAKIERPKMNLKKPRVKMKKTVRPRTAQRISVKNSPSMPDVQLPDVSGMGSGLSGGIGGYELMPDVSDIGMFGSTKSVSVGNDFEGTFYSLNMDRQGKFEEMGFQTYLETVARFIANDWSPYVLAPYYRAPKKLYTTQFAIPTTDSGLGPSSFGLGWETLYDPYRWLCHYKGKFASKKGGRYRFWSMADDVLLVRVNGELVLNGTWGPFQREVCDWNPQSKEHLEYYMGHIQASVGNWFTLEPGQVYDMELLCGEVNGGGTACMLLIEDEEESPYYSKREDGLPILPIFRTAEISEKVKTEVMYKVPVDEADFEGGEIFSVY